MLRKSVNRFSDRVMLNYMESITFIHPGWLSPDGS
jgi:hypothetical protein